MAKRNYPDNGYPSVTQVLGVLRKIGLELWFKHHTAAFCDKKSNRGKECGTQIHEAIQSHIETNEVKIETQYAEEVSNALKSFILFKKEHPEITLEKSEMELTSEIYKYNGTLDVKGKILDIPAIGDWKTSEKKDKEKPQVYDEYIYQTAAYIKAYNEINKTEIDKGFIVILAKDAISYNLVLLDKDIIESSFNNAFLPALSILNEQKRTKEFIKLQGGK